MIELTSERMFGHPILSQEEAESLHPRNLNDLCTSTEELDEINFFFMLLASYHHHLGRGRRELAAHLAFLMAYDLFILITLLSSCPLSLHYIRQAIALNPLEDYLEWERLIQQGN